MKPVLIRSKFRYLAGVVLVTCSCLNVGHFSQYVSSLPPRQSDGRIIWEQRLAGIRDALRSVHYNQGSIAYMPAGVLKGRPRTDTEDVDWVQVRYALIPLNVLQDTLDAPYVIAESSGGIEGFTTLYDARNGWVLLQRKSEQ